MDLRDYYRQMAAEISDEDMRKAAQFLSDHIGKANAVSKRDDERRLVQEYLTGKKSLKEIDGRMLAAMLDWLKPDKSPDGSGMYVISQLALTELAAVTKAAMEAAGQVTLL